MRHMAYNLRCPCGESITALETDFVPAVQAHLAAEHPGRDYSETEIMMMAMTVPDRSVKSDG
ncbi:hypothetical protein GOTRE_130_00570 [Gordonia terrae NBRC 100016]|uniref:DUF1059 domain-containing protein n=2 Tax=Gordoniaceae TaxID=85026 RepID=A0ABQ0HIV1_9ACTN|nr:hypothetical protein GOTRE_130_00570 [Gordonia terrae NBRC 100016]